MTQTLSPHLVRRYFSKHGAREVFQISGKTGETNGHPPDFRRQRENQQRLPHGRAQPCLCVLVAALCPECLNLTEPKVHSLFKTSSSAPQALHPHSTFCESDDSSSPKGAAISSQRAASFCTGSLSQSVLEHGPDTFSSVRQDIAELSVQAQCVYSSICQWTLCQSRPVAFGMTLLHTWTGNSFPETWISVGLLIFRIYLFLL